MTIKATRKDSQTRGKGNTGGCIEKIAEAKARGKLNFSAPQHFVIERLGDSTYHHRERHLLGDLCKLMARFCQLALLSPHVHVMPCVFATQLYVAYR